MDQKEGKQHRQPRTTYAVTCSDARGRVSRRWRFTNRPAAETALKRLSGHPTAECRLETEELWTSAPPADTVRVLMSLDGEVLQTSKPFPNLRADRRTTMTQDGYGDGSLMVDLPATSTRGGRDNATRLWEFLSARHLVPETAHDMRSLIAHYRGLPWWIERPATPGDPERRPALHGLLICPECSRFLDETTIDGRRIYSCPGGRPACRCRELPADNTRQLIIWNLRHLLCPDEHVLETARELQGPSADPQYHRELALQTIETDDRIRRGLEEETDEHMSIREWLAREPEERAELRAAITECAEQGRDPLAELEDQQDAGGEHHQTFSVRYLMMLLTRDDSAGAATWFRRHVRCIDPTPGAEQIHYRQLSGRERRMWDAADSDTYLKRVVQGN